MLYANALVGLDKRVLLGQGIVLINVPATMLVSIKQKGSESEEHT
jgi:hypothetical protein